MTCTIPGCSLPVHARGWCKPHYSRWHRRGDPEAAPLPRGGNHNEERWFTAAPPHPIYEPTGQPCGGTFRPTAHDGYGRCDKCGWVAIPVPTTTQGETP